MRTGVIPTAAAASIPRPYRPQYKDIHWDSPAVFPGQHGKIRGSGFINPTAQEKTVISKIPVNGVSSQTVIVSLEQLLSKPILQPLSLS